uniref:Uncharacterized protein n=1 Tax=Arundo donax TaxID=35708 RepID=A0A0A9CYY8_ARUDO
MARFLLQGQQMMAPGEGSDRIIGASEAARAQSRQAQPPFGSAQAQQSVAPLSANDAVRLGRIMLSCDGFPETRATVAATATSTGRHLSNCSVSTLNSVRSNVFLWQEHMVSICCSGAVVGMVFQGLIFFIVRWRWLVEVNGHGREDWSTGPRNGREQGWRRGARPWERGVEVDSNKGM